MNPTYIRMASKPTYDSVVDGPGIRTVLWTQGCPHDCPECHNPGTHDFNGGALYDIKDVINDILKHSKSVTFSGGDPFCQPIECSMIAKELKKNGFNIWAYSGWTYEELINKSKSNHSIMDFLKNIDRLVDGRFMIEKRSLELPFCGSLNQRIINVPESLYKGHAIIDISILGDISPKKDPNIFI